MIELQRHIAAGVVDFLADCLDKGIIRVQHRVREVDFQPVVVAVAGATAQREGEILAHDDVLLSCLAARAALLSKCCCRSGRPAANSRRNRRSYRSFSCQVLASKPASRIVPCSMIGRLIMDGLSSAAVTADSASMLARTSSGSFFQVVPRLLITVSQPSLRIHWRSCFSGAPAFL